MKYDVVIAVDATIYITVDANSPEEAAEKGLEECSTPTLCSYCSREVALGDPLDVLEVNEVKTK